MDDLVLQSVVERQHLSLLEFADTVIGQRRQEIIEYRDFLALS